MTVLMKRQRRNPQDPQSLLDTGIAIPVRPEHISAKNWTLKNLVPTLMLRKKYLKNLRAWPAWRLPHHLSPSQSLALRNLVHHMLMMKLKTQHLPYASWPSPPSYLLTHHQMTPLMKNLMNTMLNLLNLHLSNNVHLKIFRSH